MAYTLSCRILVLPRLLSCVLSASAPLYCSSTADTMATVNAKVLSLMVLVVQNTFLVLLLRYSRTVEGPMYLASTAVVCTELVKFAICFGVLFHRNSYDVEKTAAQLKTEIFYKFHETAKLSVPSVLYTIQNNLLYVALSNLNAATFQVRGPGII